MSEETNASHNASRRTFLAGACTLAVVALTGGLATEPAQAVTGVEPLGNGKVKVTVSKIKALRKNGGVALIGMVGEAHAAVVRVDAKTYYALDLSCTHQGVTVKRNASGFACPAHGSQFTAAGALQRGPAKLPLARLRTKFASGVLTVG